MATLRTSAWPDAEVLAGFRTGTGQDRDLAALLKQLCPIFAVLRCYRAIVGPQSSVTDIFARRTTVVAFHGCDALW